MEIQTTGTDLEQSRCIRDVKLYFWISEYDCKHSKLALGSCDRASLM